MKSKTVKLISGVAVLAVLSGTYIGVTSYADSYTHLTLPTIRLV